jgi:Ca2+-transporting ATPase
VQALQASGEIVAVTGDGVNDVPALQVADVGIAMGERATRSAREVAAIVLLDDCFSTIVSAIAEGRQLFRNLQLSFRYLLMIHIPLVVTAALIPLAGFPLLYLPIHVVWLELVIHPSALLAFQDLPARGRLADTRGRSARGFFSRSEWVGTALVGTLLTVLVSFGYQRSLGANGDVEHGRAMALVVLCVASAGVTGLLSGLRSRASRWIVAGTLALTAALVQIAPLASRLHVRPLHLDEWGIAIGGGALACLPLLLGGSSGERSHAKRSTHAA